MNTKKFLIVYVLKILENETDIAHPITQTKIAQIISDKYPCDRKTVGRNIKFLIEAKYPIIKTSKGFYMDKKAFTVDETEFIINAIRKSEQKTIEKKEDIINRLSCLLVQIKR